MSEFSTAEDPQTDLESCFAVTRALCNECGCLCESKVVFRSGRVYLVKWCQEHHQTEALISSDQKWFLRSLAYLKPSTSPKAHSVDKHTGCPSSCGLCPSHEQHTCVPILEITGRCDMNCPVCLVDRERFSDISVEQVKGIIDSLIHYEGAINMLTLSGGEPLLHPEILKIIDAARRPEIGVLSVSTNGLRLLDDDDLIKALRDRDVVISLQFDGFSPETYATLRGRADLADIKRRLVDRIIELGARLSLTVTLARHVNEHEVGGILDLLFEHDNILSVMVQPLAYTTSGVTHLNPDPMDVLTIPDVVRLLTEASNGILRESDISPLPCSHPSCFALTYLLKTDEGRLIPLPRIIESESYVDIIKNQALMGTDTDTLLAIRDSLYALWSSRGIVPEREAVMRTVKRLLLEMNKLDRGASHKELISLGVQNVKSIFIHHFMDRYTFDLTRAVKCCNHYPQVDGRLVPACIRNNALSR